MADENKFLNTETKAIPVPEKNIGIESSEKFYDDIITAGLKSEIDLTTIESFSQISQNRNLTYNVLDIMGEDTTIAAILETYAEDATEANEEGHIVWAESEDSNVAHYINFLLDEINVDKHIFKWVHSLCKYGDVYLKLYRESEYNDELFSDEEKDASDRKILKEDKQNLEEDVKINVFDKQDHYSNYVEMVPNPAELFEVTQLGKTYAYIEAPVSSATISHRDEYLNMATTYKYSFKKKDVHLYSATEFAHACLEDNSSRTPEEIQLFITDEKTKEERPTSNYVVRRGQSLLYNSFKIWRNLMLLENSVMLNRLTKSSIVRIIEIEMGDMPKENVRPTVLGVKQLIEQKSAIDDNVSMQEYTNPGPIENNVYIPTRNGKGSINTKQVGGDVDVKSLADLDYFKNKFFGGLRVPKQFFGDTDDATGFNGGSSLTIISSRYAKMIKRIQNTIIQALNDVINLFLIDRNQNAYINKFELHMMPPVTQEDIDRRDTVDSKVGVIANIMNLLDEVEDKATKLEILKALLGDAVSNQQVMTLLQDYIDKIEKTPEEETTTNEGDDDFSIDINTPRSRSRDDFSSDFENSIETSSEEEPDIENTSTESETVGELPSASDLGVDMTDMNMEI